MEECRIFLDSLMVCMAYGMYYRKIECGKGYVFQSRFKSTLIENDSYLIQSLLYLLLNPVRAGIVHSAEAYTWSSINEYFSSQPFGIVDAVFVNELFGSREQMILSLGSMVNKELEIIRTKHGEILGNHEYMKDLAAIDGLTDTMEFETLDDQGLIKLSWMEYIAKAFQQINDRHAKNIVLHLSKYRDREWTRAELHEALNLEMPESDLEKKLKALVKTDIINQGTSNNRYRGVNDNIFDKVFRGVYEEDIREFDTRVIREEYSDELRKERKRYKRLLGKYNWLKGYHAEFLILDRLLLARKNNELLKSITRFFPSDFEFCDYSRVWKYHSSPEYARVFSVDIFARSVKADDYSIIGEVKNRDAKKFSVDELKEFELKFAEIKKRENLERVVGFIFSRSGFTREAEEYCRERGIACSEDEKRLESGKLKQPVV
jgi:hypothetical protein